ncbi:MAG: hypothetical protein FRX49_08499 [Trebouxia sp. A1-2]|nr:MAG: hypothetical protein FRX49_08499 [Trebouxia sp. A1-2]
MQLLVWYKTDVLSDGFCAAQLESIGKWSPESDLFIRRHFVQLSQKAACDACKARCTFEEVALRDEGEVGEPALQAIKDVGGIHNGGPSHLTLLPATPTHIKKEKERGRKMEYGTKQKKKGAAKRKKKNVKKKFRQRGEEHNTEQFKAPEEVQQVQARHNIHIHRHLIQQQHLRCNTHSAHL